MPTKSASVKGTATSRTKKPATKPTTKPAASKPAAKTGKDSKAGGIGIKQIAEKLNRDERSVRASIRRILGGPQVGKGGRYHWSSWDDKALKALMTDLQKTSAE